jgi:hypothetical protein
VGHSGRLEQQGLLKGALFEQGVAVKTNIQKFVRWGLGTRNTPVLLSKGHPLRPLTFKPVSPPFTLYSLFLFHEDRGTRLI